MVHPHDLQEPLGPILAAVNQTAESYLAGIEDAPAKLANRVFPDLSGELLPEKGDGALAAIDRLTELLGVGAINTAGPRFFQGITGGTTPAALAGDWLCSAFDQHAYAVTNSPVAVNLEQLVIRWLVDMFALPSGFGGALVSGGSTANVTALAAARQWWGQQHGVDIAESGTSSLPQIPVLTTGYAHGSVAKALAILGMGRRSLAQLSPDGYPLARPSALVDALEALDGQPAIVVANAGEVNTGAFDPISEMADIAHRYNCWLHVDGAFGLFARVSPRTAHLADGVEIADSIAVDAHKWLNVPFDSGVVLLRDVQLLPTVFRLQGPYLPDSDDGEFTPGNYVPELSRRARAFAIFATLSAYGRHGYRAIVERGCEMASHLADLVRSAPDFELLAEPEFCVASFRYRPAGVPEAELDDLNRRLGQAMLRDGTIFPGTTVHRGNVAFKPAFVNWRITQRQVDEVLPTLRRVAGELRVTCA